MTFTMPWRKALVTAALFFATPGLQAKEKVVAYVPNWVDLKTFTEDDRLRQDHAYQHRLREPDQRSRRSIVPSEK